MVLSDETRPVFQGIGTVGEAAFYVLATATIVLFFWGFYRRVRKYRRGRPAARTATLWKALFTSPAQGVRRRGDNWSVGAVAANTSVGRRDRAAGIAHFFIFWGFITLFLGTVILTIDYDILRNASKLISGHELSFFHGVFYVVYSFILDTMGLTAVLGLAYMAVRRGFLRPRKLDYQRAEHPEGGYSRKRIVAGDWVFLGLFGAILVSGYLLEAFRIVGARFPPFEVWSPVGWVLARVFSALGMSPAGGDAAHLVQWWVHAVLALAFVVYIPFSKAMHMLLDAANLLVHDRSTARQLPAPPPEAEHAGYRELADFTWKELLDLDACTKCGRCHEVCPARTAGAPLSPRDLILDLRQWADTQAGGVTLLDRETRADGSGPLTTGEGGKIAGEVVSARTLWSCTTCMHCVEVCPVGIEHVPTIVQLRRGLVDEGEMDPTLQQALKNLSTQGNSFGKSARMRARWTKGLDFKIPDARKEAVRYLWFVGDFASFDDRLQGNSQALAEILHDAGVDFGLLYDGERNAGNDVRRVGEEGLFELLAEHNIAALEQAHFDEIFTTDPHSLNTLRNEYPARGAKHTVWHYTELLADLVESGTIKVEPLGYRVTYHDPCYLARYNGVVEAPRRLLRALGCELVEMPRNGANTFCCGAGGGRIWMDDSFLAERPSENRIREAMELGVDHFVVACPKDVTMYSDAVKTTGNEDRLAVRDITLLVREALRRPAEPGVLEVAAT
ncbi:4Fe-4S dicluster domain-containing protein [Amycolatopsis sp. K13G38]|uniref:4Fe-4S dicluster domain-containing protein n=1 Tax=Amycolatopsis acididurans TaxID=2724524 RepID=A0ABX1J429_9PSEU|nr:heterodisulfide reductase-related iron-sulfur binding cluster [Amycolatopsis acididurans]NKQ54379.1 4Fe-4S dicluster domain-containing protein [Amycolatopsis acididurans]